MTTLYLVLPCYNEEEMLPISVPLLKDKLYSLIKANRISDKSRILFVNDGSRDKTWEILKALHEEDGHISCVNLSRNRGQQYALLAGMNTAVQFADAIITMDVDLQDDIGAIDGMLEKYEKEGCEVVYGVRSSRKEDGILQRINSGAFYKVVKKMGADVVSNHAEYRLMSKRAVLALEEYKETHLFLRGLVPMVGFKSGVVYYKREKRAAGKSHYPLKKLLALAYEAITSLTLTPIKLIKRLGIALSVLGFAGIVATVVLFCLGITGSEWIILSSVFAVGGLVQLSVGIVGDYAGRAYMESKRRPQYFIDEILNDSGSTDE